MTAWHDGTREETPQESGPHWSARYDAIFCVFLGAAIYLWGGNARVVLPQLYYLLVAMMALNVAASAWLRRRPHVEWPATAAILANCAVTTAMLEHSGGVDSNLWVLYLLPINTACVGLGARETALVTGGAVSFIAAYYALTVPAFGPAVYFELVVKAATLTAAAVAVYRASARERGSRGLAQAYQQGLWDAEKRLQLLRSLFDCSGDPALIVDAASGRVVDSNGAADKMFGFKPGQLRDVRPSADELGLRSSGRPWSELVRELDACGGHAAVEITARRLDGSSWPAEASAAAISLGAEKFIVAFVRDVSRRKRVEEQQVRSRKMEAMIRLAGGLAHDFNNILTTIMGLTELRLAAAGPGDPARNDLSEILESVRRAAGLIRQLLAFSSRQAHNPKDVRLDDLMRRMNDSVRRLAGEGVEPAFDLQPAPPCRVDPVKIEQAVLNLVRNAVEAMPSGGRLKILTGPRRLAASEPAFPDAVPAGEFAILVVSDTGLGMSAEALDSIFDPFYTTKAGHGIGLGLSAAYGIIRQNKGFIQVSSAPGRGSEFTIYFPAVLAPKPEPSAPAAPPASGKGRATVLIAEDEEGVRRLVRRILAREGYVLLEARDGSEAIELARTHSGPIDILLTDIVMPGLGGRELADLMSRERPETKIVFMSGHMEHAGMLANCAEGVNFISKPFRVEDLVQILRRTSLGAG